MIKFSAPKILVFLFLAASLLFAAAPDWIKSGTAITYAITPAGSAASSLTYSVSSRTTTAIAITLTNGDGSNAGTVTDNASGISGSFWYDSTQLANLNIGDSIDGWQVLATNVQTTAGGTTWNAIKLQNYLSGLQTIRLADMQTGLLLSQQNSQVNAVFSSVNPPFNSNVPAQNPPQNNKQNNSPGQRYQSPQNNQNVPNYNSTQSQLNASNYSNEQPPLPAELKSPDASVPCCPIAFIFVIVGLLIYKNNH